jgi:hypothetical protein
MIRRQVVLWRGHVPEEIGREERKEYRVMVPGFLEKVSKLVLHLGKIGCIENDIDRVIRMGQGRSKIFVDRNACLPGPLNKRMAGIDFAHPGYTHPTFSQFPEFFIEARTDTSQADQEYRNRFHPTLPDCPDRPKIAYMI